MYKKVKNLLKTRINNKVLAIRINKRLVCLTYECMIFSVLNDHPLWMYHRIFGSEPPSTMNVWSYFRFWMTIHYECMIVFSVLNDHPLWMYDCIFGPKRPSTMNVWSYFRFWPPVTAATHHAVGWDGGLQLEHLVKSGVLCGGQFVRVHLDGELDRCVGVVLLVVAANKNKQHDSTLGEQQTPRLDIRRTVRHLLCVQNAWNEVRRKESVFITTPLTNSTSAIGCQTKEKQSLRQPNTHECSVTSKVFKAF